MYRGSCRFERNWVWLSTNWACMYTSDHITAIIVFLLICTFLLLTSGDSDRSQTKVREGDTVWWKWERRAREIEKSDGSKWVLVFKVIIASYCGKCLDIFERKHKPCAKPKEWKRGRERERENLSRANQELHMHQQRACRKERD